jgi:hypothetical protein
MQSKQSLLSNHEHDPLVKASKLIASQLGIYRIIALAPVILVLCALTGFTLYQKKWFYDPFLDIMFLIFIAGQMIAFFQIRGFGKRLRTTSATVNLLAQAGDKPDLQALYSTLSTQAGSCAERDLVMQWLELGTKGESQSCTQLAVTAQERQADAAAGTIGLHTILNRTQLKMGFLGTLIGLAQTFPPMKRAILGLSDSGGQMRFVRDIATAIDGDAYAILTTLVATGLSVLVETLSIQVLDRFLGAFERIFGYLNDWYLCVVQPVVQRDYSAAGHQNVLIEKQAENARHRTEVQVMVEKHVREMAGIMKLSFEELSELGGMQKAANERLSRLMEYECEYMNSLVPKSDETAGRQAVPVINREDFTSFTSAA